MSEEIAREVLRNAQDDGELQKQKRLRRARLEFFARVYAFEAVGFVLPRYLAIAEADYRVALGERQARAVPPIAAHGGQRFRPRAR